jgi:hypothetical protein
MKTGRYILLLLIIGSVGYFLIQKNKNYSGQGTFIGNIQQGLYSKNYKQVKNAFVEDKSKEVSLQEINNLSYTFYLGQIDNPDVVLSDDLKTEITKVVYNSKFPKSILKETPIIIVNSLALKPELYIQMSGSKLRIIDFGPIFLYEGGVYSTYGNNKSVIYINKTTLDKKQLTGVLTHELGHAIGKTLTEGDWKKYYELRNIPVETARTGGLWNLSPSEDFAEVYKNIFTGQKMKTYYGLLMPIYEGFDGILEATCGKTYKKIYDSKVAKYQKINEDQATLEISQNKSENCIRYSWMCGVNIKPVTEAQYQESKDIANTSSEVQSCRREVMANPSKYPDDWDYGEAPYKSSVDLKTKEFINTILGRLN